MVSRKHAEFRLADGRCTVNDTGSRFGTFVNGERISGPMEVRVGSRVQLGSGGPLLRIVAIEQSPVDSVAPAADMGRMETVHDASLANFGTAPVVSSPTSKPRSPS